MQNEKVEKSALGYVTSDCLKSLRGEDVEPLLQRLY